MTMKNKLAQIFHFDLYGKRQEKYNFLLENNLQTVEWTELQPTAPNYFFVPKDFAEQEEYDKGFSITELFALNSVGVKTHNDEELVSFNQFAKNNYSYDYRVFDNRCIDYNLQKVARHRYAVMQHFIKGQNIGLVVARQCVSDWRYVFVTNNISDINLIASAGILGGGNIFPLYLYLEGDIVNGERMPDRKAPNLNEANLTGFQNLLGFVPTPEQIFDYIYAVLHSPSYREKYKEFLKIDFPRIPYPQDAEYFNKMAAFGENLRKLHLMENIVPQQNRANFPKSGSNAVEKPMYKPEDKGINPLVNSGKVWINDVQYFDNVPQAAWSFYIGGYQPAQKWLKDRKNRTLSYEDIEHYQKIIFVLSETDRIMGEIDLIL
jgi:predicted helicase